MKPKPQTARYYAWLDGYRAGMRGLSPEAELDDLESLSLANPFYQGYFRQGLQDARAELERRAAEQRQVT